MTTETVDITGLVEAFTYAMTHEDVEDIIKLWAQDGEWVIMATGQTFRGLDEIRQLMTRSVAARVHKSGMGLLPYNVFTNSEGTKLIWEYVHKGIVTSKWPLSKGIVTDKWPASTRKAAMGTKFELPIILMCEIHLDKITRIREYFDLQSLTEAGTPHHLYSQI